MKNGIIMPKEVAALWEAVNALGGTAREGDDFGKGINHAIGQALLEIEMRFQHVHVRGHPPEQTTDTCALCGLHLWHDIHKRGAP